MKINAYSNTSTHLTHEIMYIKNLQALAFGASTQSSGAWLGLGYNGANKVNGVKLDL